MPKTQRDTGKKTRYGQLALLVGIVALGVSTLATITIFEMQRSLPRSRSGGSVGTPVRAEGGAFGFMLPNGWTVDWLNEGRATLFDSGGIQVADLECPATAEPFDAEEQREYTRNTGGTVPHGITLRLGRRDAADGEGTEPYNVITMHREDTGSSCRLEGTGSASEFTRIYESVRIYR